MRKRPITLQFLLHAFTCYNRVFNRRILIPAALCMSVNIPDYLTPLVVLFDLEHLRDVMKNWSGI